MIAKLPGIHAGLRGNKVKLGAAPGKVHVFANGIRCCIGSPGQPARSGGRHR